MVKRQHYIPQFYLKRFGKKGKIDVYDIQNKKYIPNADVSNFACKKLFYDIDASKLEKELSLYKKIYKISDETKYQEILNNPQLIEETFSRLESKMADYLNKFESNFSLINDEEFMSTFFLFIRTLSVRTIGYREQLENITTQITEWLNKLNIKQCKNYPLDVSPKELAKIQQLRTIVSLPQTHLDAVNFFSNYDIFIGVNNSNIGFILSNEPFLSFVSGFNDICFPINPKLSIIMRAKNVDDEFLICKKKPDSNNIINLDVKDVVKYNILQNHLMSKYLFGNRKDIEYTIKIISITEEIRKNIL